MSKPVVFVIDDDESVSASICRLLKSMGYSTRGFTSAREFLTLECQNLCGCLVLDVRLPEMNGLELQQKMIESGSKMPIIFMSAHEDASASEKALKAGATAFLRKPFDDQDILKLVRSALSQVKNQDENQDHNENDKEQ